MIEIIYVQDFHSLRDGLRRCVPGEAGAHQQPNQHVRLEDLPVQTRAIFNS